MYCNLEVSKSKIRNINQTGKS